MKMPRVTCRTCRRSIAAGVVAGHASKGRIWRHDPALQTRGPGTLLISCPGSLEIVDLPRPGEQLAFPVEDEHQADEHDHQAEDAPALF